MATPHYLGIREFYTANFVNMSQLFFGLFFPYSLQPQRPFYSDTLMGASLSHIVL